MEQFLKMLGVPSETQAAQQEGTGAASSGGGDNSTATAATGAANSSVREAIAARVAQVCALPPYPHHILPSCQVA
jgi:hypothetical protein